MTEPVRRRAGPLGTWQRVMPSGYVHFIDGVSNGRWRLACGRWQLGSTLTTDYPPATRRCPACEEAVGEDDD